MNSVKVLNQLYILGIVLTSQNIFRLRPRILSSLAGLALGRHVLVDGLGALRDGVLGELAWQDQPHGSLEKKRNKGRKKGKK